MSHFVQLCVCVNLMKLFPCYSVLHVGTLAGLPRAPGRGYRERLCVCQFECVCVVVYNCVFV